MSLTQPPIDYIYRTRTYYAALGYDQPYQWAVSDEVPFTPVTGELSSLRAAVVTTAAPFRAEKGDQGPGAEYNGAAKFYDVYTAPMSTASTLRISHIAYDRKHTSADDVNSYFPIEALKEFQSDGVIGAVSNQFIGLPTDRSHRATMTKYAPDVLRHCKRLAADVVLLYPNCPVCHQSVTLVAQYLEAHGIPTVVFGCARDIVLQVGAPRFLFSDFPLGNAAGKPFDRASQRMTLALGLRLLVQATGPRALYESAERWSESDDWKNDFCNIEMLDASEIQSLREQFDREKEKAKANKFPSDETN